MPQMDGIKATQLMREYLTNHKKLKRSKQPYIVGITGHCDDKHKNHGKEAGMDRVIEKPCYYQVIRELLLKTKLI